MEQMNRRRLYNGAKSGARDTPSPAFSLLWAGATSAGDTY